MAARESLQAGMVGTGGYDRAAVAPHAAARGPLTHHWQARRVGLHTAAPTRQQWSAAAAGAVAADHWPHWAQAQLEQAIALASRAPAGTSVTTLLVREWFAAPLGGVDALRVRRPLVSAYRSAYAEGARAGGHAPAARHVLGADHWWRTWGAHWTPPRTRPGSVRLVLSPRPERVADVVRLVSSRLAASTAAWSLNVATQPSRVRRVGSAVLDTASIEDVPPLLLTELAPLLRPVTAPLALPVAPGIGLTHHATSGMSFGEHRCHLIALGLRRGGEPLGAIADVFAAHGIDPTAPYRSR